jgi:DNA-binding MarR family transcriptional regulator
MTGESAGEPAEVELGDEGFLASSGYLLARIGVESRRRWRHMLAEHGLGEHGFGVLMALDQVGPRSQQELSRILGIDPRNAVAVLDGLEDRSLVERAPDLTDRRRHAVGLTPAGRSLLEGLRVDGASTEQEMLAGLSGAERIDLHRLLVKLLATMTDTS